MWVLCHINRKSGVHLGHLRPAVLASLLGLATSASLACSSSAPKAPSEPQVREYVWNDTEQRSCQKPPPRAETLTIRHLNTAMAKRDLGWTSLLSSRNLNEPEPFHFLNSHLERCIRAFNRADRPEPSGIVYSAFSVDCEGAVSSIRAVTTSLTADTVNCVLTQVAKTRFPPPEGGTNIVDFTLRAHQPKAAHPHAQLAP